MAIDLALRDNDILVNDFVAGRILLLRAVLQLVISALVVAIVGRLARDYLLISLYYRMRIGQFLALLLLIHHHFVRHWQYIMALTLLDHVRRPLRLLGQRLHLVLHLLHRDLRALFNVR